MGKQKVTVGDMINSKKKISDKKYELDDIKELLNISEVSNKWKPDRFLSVSPAIESVLNKPDGLIPLGHSTMILGHSNVGKTSLILDCAVACQKNNILPIFIISEMKWSNKHLKDSGFEMTETVDEETGEITYSGNYIMVDYSTIKTIEDAGAFIMKCLDLQRKGKIKSDIFLIYDSVGTLPSRQALDSSHPNNMMNANAMSNIFGRGVCREISLTRKSDMPYTATLVAVNHCSVNMHVGEYMAKPTLDPINGWGYFKQCTVCIVFGDVTKAGTSAVKATKKGKEFQFGTRTKVKLTKWHAEGVETSGKVILTEHGFIEDSPIAIKEYTKKYSQNWSKHLGIENDLDKSFNIVDEDMNDDED